MYATAPPYVNAASLPVGEAGDFVQELFPDGSLNIIDSSEVSNASASLGMNNDAGAFSPQLDLVADTTLPHLAPGLRLFLEGVAENWLAWFDGSVNANGDYIFGAADKGPVIIDQSDGHTYRIIATAGILSTEEVS